MACRTHDDRAATARYVFCIDRASNIIKLLFWLWLFSIAIFCRCCCCVLVRESGQLTEPLAMILPIQCLKTKGPPRVRYCNPLADGILFDLLDVRNEDEPASIRILRSGRQRRWLLVVAQDELVLSRGGALNLKPSLIGVAKR